MKRGLAVFGMMVSISMGSALEAQALKGIKNPANLPPASYKGAQFVDNNGCVFVRAGRLGNVTWVPRVDARRRHICNASFLQIFGDRSKLAQAK